ncbi:hypothetical protein Lser_V15G06955 [Lactuca serriola]
MQVGIPDRTTVGKMRGKFVKSLCLTNLKLKQKPPPHEERGEWKRWATYGCQKFYHMTR